MSLYDVPAPLISIILLILLLAIYILGHRVRVRRYNILGDNDSKQLGTVSGTLVGLLALLLAFTFGMANNRFDATRELVMQEANEIGTAIKRVEAYPDSIQHVLKKALRNYVEMRIQYYEVGHTEAQIHQAYLQSSDSLDKIWKLAIEFNKQETDIELKAQFLPAVNDMMDIITARLVARESTVPEPLLYFLFCLSLTVSFLLGYADTGKVDWIVAFGFTLMLSLTIYAILDIDRPRRGLITLDKVHERIYELRDAF
jgi:hypothetical protein